MAKAANNLFFVQITRACFHPADGVHFVIVLEGVIPGEADVRPGTLL